MTTQVGLWQQKRSADGCLQSSGLTPAETQQTVYAGGGGGSGSGWGLLLILFLNSRPQLSN